jgi:hypothetical protein
MSGEEVDSAAVAFESQLNVLDTEGMFDALGSIDESTAADTAAAANADASGDAGEGGDEAGLDRLCWPRHSSHDQR